MSTLASIQMTSPANKTEECARFTIADAREKFTFSDVAVVGEEYTLGFWVKSEADGSILVKDKVFSTTTEWTRHTLTYTADGKDLVLDFEAAGTYYIYHIQLEIGNMATDWTVAVEDVDKDINDAATDAQNAQNTANDAVGRVASAEALLQILSDSIQTLVRDENGESLMVQDGNGWTFNMGSYSNALSDVSAGLDDLSKSVGSTQGTVNGLNTALNELVPLKSYVIVTEYNGQPCIELGKAENSFKLRITNTEIQFIDGTIIPAYLSNQKLYIEKAEVRNELQFGGFVWKKRSNRNMGLMWVGGDS